MFVDLDDFNVVNDAHGQRLKSCVKVQDTVSRTGGDEFVIILEGLGSYPEDAASQVDAIARKILAATAMCSLILPCRHGLTMLEHSRIDPCKLILELTESLLLEEVDLTVQKMTQLRQTGLRFSLDDFGTGYSLLSYLKLLPLHEIKIDRSFVRLSRWPKASGCPSLPRASRMSRNGTSWWLPVAAVFRDIFSGGRCR